MTYQEAMEFEVMIYESIEREGIDNADDLEEYENILHNRIAGVFNEYARDNNIDYESAY